MDYDELDLEYGVTDVLGDENERGLDSDELYRLAFFAEHPELADPLIWFLPKKPPGARYRTR